MDPTTPTPKPIDPAVRHSELNPEQPLPLLAKLLKDYGNLLVVAGLLFAFFGVRYLIRHFITQRAGGYDDGTLNAPVLAALLYFIDAMLAMLAMRITWPRGFRVLRSCLETDLLSAGIAVVYRPTNLPQAHQEKFAGNLERYGSADMAKLIADIFNVLLKCFQLVVFLLLYAFYFYLIHALTLAALGLIPHDAAGLLK